MYKDTLIKSGLNPVEADIYELLIRFGPSTAKLLVTRTTHKRGLTYKTLDRLVEMGLVEKHDAPGQIATFSPVHPDNLKNIAVQRVREAEQSLQSLSGIIGQMASDWNLISGKPGVRFFEGEKGATEIADDSLTAHSEILTFADVEALEKHAHESNKAYVKRRERLGKKKRLIVSDSAFNRKFFESISKDITDVRYLKSNLSFANTVVQIYDNKVSYLTLLPERMIGVIVEDELIANFNRSLFEYIWPKAESKIIAPPVEKPKVSLEDEF